MLWLFGVFLVVNCYNIDIDHPIVIENPDKAQPKSYFGYSLVLYSDKDQNEKWIKIGAPKAKYKSNNGTGSVYQSGVVYNCPFMQQCTIEEKLNYTNDKKSIHSFTGGAMDVNYKLKILAISANGWHDTFTRLDEIAAAQGSFFLENINKKAFGNRYNPLKKPESYKYLPYYQRSMTGFSLHFPQNENEILVGAPGVYNYLGTVFKVKNINETQDKWKVDVIAPQGHYYEYSGYAVTSGYFYPKSELHYVTGLPKGFDEMKKERLFNVPYGMVLIFTFTKNAPQTRIRNEVKSKLKEELFGSQFGEYFGSSLAAGDLNSDGFDDLMVGAPYRSNDKTGYNHGSVYVFYGHNGKLGFGLQNRVDGAVSGGRFGSALMVLGDLDYDGYNELAISAPNEDNSGVIYIYNFDPIMKTLKISQKIEGKNINPNLKGFGMSFSKATDIDDNHFPDFAVGSPLSGHTVILRTKPIVSLYSNIKISSLLLSKDIKGISFQCCYSFTSFASENLTLIRNVTVDERFNRFSFENGKNNEGKLINNEQDMENIEYCQTINLTRTKVHNYNDAIPITLTYKIAEKPNEKNPIVIDNGNTIKADSFCKTCPQLSEKSQTTDAKLVFWHEKCNHFGQLGPCVAQLEIEARFLGLLQKNTFILGSKDLLTVEVQVTNKGDAAFSPFLEIFLPNGTSLSTAPADCQTRGNDGLNLRCEREILESKNTVTYLLKLLIDVKDTSDLDFGFKASTITEQHNEKNCYNLTLEIKRNAFFSIEGYSNESSYIYEEGKPTVIQNIFKIQKFGISPIPAVDVEILVPTEIPQIVKIIDISSENFPITCEKIIEDLNNRTRRESPLNLHCNVTSCTLIKCTVGPFEGSQNHAKLSIEMEVDFGILGRIDQVIITTTASVFSNIDGKITRYHSTDLKNIVSVHKSFVVSLWILVGSAVAGLVILICLSMGLGKAGFFERKKLKMLQKLKEDELEEERIIEEMIQKELEGQPCEGDPVFRYAKPADLETYWRQMEENALYNDPLLIMANRELQEHENK